MRQSLMLAGIFCCLSACGERTSGYLLTGLLVCLRWEELQVGKQHAAALLTVTSGHPSLSLTLNKAPQSRPVFLTSPADPIKSHLATHHGPLSEIYFFCKISIFWVQFICKYCKMHFDIINMFWYFKSQPNSGSESCWFRQLSVVVHRWCVFYSEIIWMVRNRKLELL